MRIIYEGVDITEHAELVEAIGYDNAGGRADGLSLTMQNAQKWYAWKPRQDDKVEVEHYGYTSGRMYVDTVHPLEQKYRIIATSVPAIARERRWRCHENRTLAEVMRNVAAVCQMEAQTYGMDEHLRYPFLIQENETGVAFLSRLLQLEGAVLKCVSGKISALSIAACQDMEARREIVLNAATAGIRHTRTEGAGYAGITVRTPHAEGHATDTAMTRGMWRTVTDAPALDSITAYRWARGLLLWENRKREQLEISMEFDPGITAMMPVQISGEAAMAGKWLVESAEHDFINMRTTCSLYRCVTTIK